MNRETRREAMRFTAWAIRKGITPPGSVLVGMAPDGTAEFCTTGCCLAVWDSPSAPPPARARQRPEDGGTVGTPATSSAFGRAAS